MSIHPFGVGSEGAGKGNGRPAWKRLNPPREANSTRQDEPDSHDKWASGLACQGLEGEASRVSSVRE